MKVLVLSQWTCGQWNTSSRVPQPTCFWNLPKSGGGPVYEILNDSASLELCELAWIRNHNICIFNTNTFFWQKRNHNIFKFLSFDIPSQMALGWQWQFNKINSKCFRFKSNISAVCPWLWSQLLHFWDQPFLERFCIVCKLFGTTFCWWWWTNGKLRYWTDDDGAYDVDASGVNGNGDKGDDGGVDDEVFRCTEQILSQLEVQAMQVNIIITIMIINMM